MPSEMEKQFAVLKEKYIVSLPEKIGEIRELWDSQCEGKDISRLDEFHRMVHSLTGSSATLGVMEISEQSKILESCISQNMTDGDFFSPSSLDEIERMLGSLENIDTSVTLKIQK